MPRHDGVVEVVVRLDVGDRPERRLAALPQQRPLGVVGGHADRADVACRGQLADPLDLGRDRCRQPDHLDEQRRCLVDREAGVDELLDRLQAELVHHLDGGGHDAVGDDVAHELRTVGDVGEVEQHRGAPRAGSASAARTPWWRRRTCLRCRRTRRAGRSRPVRVPRHRARVTEPSGSTTSTRVDVGAGDAVGQAVRTAGVVGDVAADRARLLAARVGREVHAEVGDLVRQVEVEHPGLDPRHAG